MNEQIIVFAITFLLGAWVTAMVIISVIGLARGIEKLFFLEGRKFLKESRARWINLCEELGAEAVSLKEQINIQVETIDSINKNKEVWAFKSGRKDEQIKYLKNAIVLADKKVNVLSIDLLKTMEELKIERMNLNPKYNPNVTRGEDGRYKSLKSVV
jgi:hypothetical protein